MDAPAKRQCTRGGWDKPEVPPGSEHAAVEGGWPPRRMSLAVSPPTGVMTTDRDRETKRQRHRERDRESHAQAADVGALLEGLSSGDFDFDARTEIGTESYRHTPCRPGHRQGDGHAGEEDGASPQRAADGPAPAVGATQAHGQPALSAEQAAALAAVRAGENVFITGCGGTGKSYLLDKVFAGWRQQYGKDFSRKVFVTAPTGIAASHLNGTTIHAASGVGVPTLRQPCGKSEFGRLWKERNKARWEEVAKIVLDEVSMFSGEWFDCLDEQVREVVCYRKRKAARDAGDVYDESHEQVLGGKQLVFVGDFFQLPPIENSIARDAPEDTRPDATTSEAKQKLLVWLKHQTHKRPANNRNANPDTSEFNIENWFFNRGYAFQSHAWARSNFRFVELKKCFRQSDARMVDNLSAIRVAEAATVPQAVSFFNAHCHGSLTSDDYLALYATNQDVDTINADKLRKLDAPLHEFRSVDAVTGDRDAFRTVTGMEWVSDEDARSGGKTVHREQKEWENELRGNAFFRDCLAVGEWKTLSGGHETRITVDLKTGAQVMLLRNIDTDGKLVNGSTGKIVDWVNAAERLVENDFCIATAKAEGNLSERELMERVRRGENLKAFVERNTHIEELKLPEVLFDQAGDRPAISRVIEPERFEAIVPALGCCYRVQLPLKLGWAITVHKSQGMTLQRAKMNLGKCRNDGQIYVALSRAKTMEGLRLEQRLLPGQIHSADVVLEFYRRCQQQQPIIGAAHCAGGIDIHHWSEQPNKSAEDLVKVNWPPGRSNSWESCKEPLSGRLVDIEEPAGNHSLVGQRFVITGYFRNTTRDAVTKVCKRHGGQVSGQVSGKTTHLIHGEKLMTGAAVDASTKYQKAKELKVEILDENQWRHMIMTRTKNLQASLTSFFPRAETVGHKREN